MILKRVGPVSLAKIASLIYAVAGLFIGLILTIGSLAGWATRQGGVSDLVFGLGAVVALPVLYGAVGFASSWLVALVYNAIAKKVGGLEVELQ